MDGSLYRDLLLVEGWGSELCCRQPEEDQEDCTDECFDILSPTIMLKICDNILAIYTAVTQGCSYQFVHVVCECVQLSKNGIIIVEKSSPTFNHLTDRLVGEDITHWSDKHLEEGDALGDGISIV